MADKEPNGAPEDVEVEEEHGESCECEVCGGACPLDPDDWALCSMLAGVAAMIFSMWGPITPLHWLGLVLGLGAVYSGLCAIKADTEWKKQAVAGVVCGTIAVCFWLLIQTVHAAAMLLRG